MRYAYLLLGETPSKKNSRVFVQKIGRLLPSKQYQKWHAEALDQLILQGIRRVQGECGITLAFTHGDLRRRDSDNGTSSILDLLVDAGVLPDDNWRVVRQLHVRNGYKKGEPSCQIVIDVAEE